MSKSLELPRHFQLNNGREIPSVGLGTFQSEANNDRVRDVVSNALKHGYRHIDTAADYGNEKQVGEGIRDSGVLREDMFVTTKLANHWHEPGDVARALETSLQNLQLDYVPYAYATSQDHSKLRHANGKPVINVELSRQYPAVWKAMELMVDSGKVLAIGLSNFNILKTKRIFESARIRPVVNQVEIHPYFAQTALLDFCKSEGIHVTAHQPLGGNPLKVVNPQFGKPGPLADAQIARVAATDGRSVAQTILAWNLMRGVSVIPKTARAERLSENLKLSALQIEQMHKINALESTVGPIRYLDPREYVGFDVFDEDNDQPVVGLPKTSSQ
ncbi:hypothetical protein MMC10_000343 [Thelotrema lepadinum]|nr:hypothetical protein [Thelotrema lepadinum]